MTLWYAWHEVGNDEVLKNSRVFSSPECIKGDSTLCIIICEAGIRIPRGDEKPSLLSSVQTTKWGSIHSCHNDDYSEENAALDDHYALPETYLLLLSLPSAPKKVMPCY